MTDDVYEDLANCSCKLPGMGRATELCFQVGTQSNSDTINNIEFF